MSRFLNWVDLRAFLRDSTKILYVTKILNYCGWNQKPQIISKWSWWCKRVTASRHEFL